jgi:hypothetical protein
VAYVVRVLCVALLSIMGVAGLAAIHSASILAQPEMVLAVGAATSYMWWSAGQILQSMSAEEAGEGEYPVRRNT